MASDAMLGSDTGTTMRHKIVSSPAPSMRAASKRPWGRFSKKDRKKKIPKIWPALMPGPNITHQVSSKPLPPTPQMLFPPASGNSFIHRYAGIRVSTPGTNISAITQVNSTLFPGKSRRANT